MASGSSLRSGTAAGVMVALRRAGTEWSGITDVCSFRELSVLPGLQRKDDKSPLRPVSARERKTTDALTTASFWVSIGQAVRANSGKFVDGRTTDAANVPRQGDAGRQLSDIVGDRRRPLCDPGLHARRRSPGTGRGRARR